MIKYEANEFVSVLVDYVDNFTVHIEDHYTAFTRDQLTELRDIIDQALNTSAEELEASGE